VTDAQKAIKEHEQDIAEERRRIEVYRPAADEVADEVRKFQAASARGDQSAMDRLRMILREANMGAGQILALKMGRRRPSS
jgi:hypothetical protein